MDKKRFAYLSLVFPALMSGTIIVTDYWFGGEFFSLFLSLSWVLTIIGLYAFVRFKPYKAWLLPIGFAVSPLPIFLYEIANPGRLQYLGTVIFALPYALPFLIISLIMAIVMRAGKKNNADSDP